jgi:hypothetical protein
MNEKVSDAEAFALMVETACEEFNVLNRLVRGEIRLVSDATGMPRILMCIQMALAKSFVFHVARAYRICKSGSQFLSKYPSERKLFIKYLDSIDLAEIRDVNEHGFDSGNPARGGRSKDSTPSMHPHEVEGMKIAVDETSLMIFDGKILIGAVNLYDVYPQVERMRQLAGYASLSGNRLGNP